MSFGTEDLTLNTADVAILLVSRPLGGGCGQAYANGYQHGTNFGWVAKNCHVRETASVHAQVKNWTKMPRVLRSQETS